MRTANKDNGHFERQRPVFYVVIWSLPGSFEMARRKASSSSPGMLVGGQ